MSMFLPAVLAIWVATVFSTRGELTLTKMMDKTANPCLDFYQYACGNYLKTKTFPKGVQYVSTMSGINKQINGRTIQILEEPVTRRNSYEEKMKKMYKSCMNSETMNSEALKNFDDCDREDWPTMNSKWTESSYDLQKMVDTYYYEGFYELSSLFRIYNHFDSEEEPPVYIIRIIQPFLWESKLAFKHYVDFAVALGADRQTAEADAGSVLNFAETLSKIMTPIHQVLSNPEKSKNPITLQEMNKKYPYINWYTTIRKIFNAMGVHISPKQIVKVDTPDFFYRLADLLKKTNKRTIANYMAVIRSEVKFGYEAGRLKHVGESTAYTDNQTCAHAVKQLYDVGMAKLLAKGVFEEKDQKYMTDLIHYFKDAYVKSINKISWAEASTHKMMLNKIKDLKTKIGIPSDKFTDKDLDELYKTYVVTGDFTADKLQNEEERKKLKLREINKGFINHKWETSITNFNGFYFPNLNEIVFPLGSVQPPLYQNNAPSYRNYAGIGTVIGHEIGHSIDSNGKKYDNLGKLRNWWTPLSEQAFNKRSECFVNQYGNYFVKQANMTVNGQQTLGENIADNAGLNAGFEAYKEFLIKNGPERGVPGLKLNNEQLFFVAYGQTYCAKYTDEKMKEKIIRDVHSLQPYRVIGPLQNSEEFSRVFNCKKGVYMNPEKKCKIY